MNKHLIALAVAAAVAAPAMAQNVSVSGRLDVGYQSKDSSGSKNNGTAYSSDTSSRITFKASEDLGGGLKAGVTIEGGLGAADAATATATALDVNMVDRAQFLTLDGGFGGLVLGFQNSPGKNIQDGYDAGGANNIEGKLPDLLSNETSRAHAITYTTPTMSGLQGFAVMMNRDNAGDSTGTGSAFGLNYAAGALKASVQSTTLKNTDAFETKQMSFGASYNLGFAMLSGFYMDVKKEASSEVNEDGYQLGINVPLSHGVQVYAQMAKADSKTGTAASLDRSGNQFGIKKALSKRTYVYAIAGNQNIKTSSGDGKTDTYALGMVHAF